jgi:hypothetical protein
MILVLCVAFSQCHTVAWGSAASPNDANTVGTLDPA